MRRIGLLNLRCEQSRGFDRVNIADLVLSKHCVNNIDLNARGSHRVSANLDTIGEKNGPARPE